MSNPLDDAVSDYYADHDAEILQDYLEKNPKLLADWLIKNGSGELWDKLLTEFLNDYKSSYFDSFSFWATEYITEMLRDGQYPDRMEEA